MDKKYLYFNVKKGWLRMLKNEFISRILLIAFGFLMTMGIVLSGIGFAMGGGIDYLKEEDHQWYQLVSVQDDSIYIGLSFSEDMIIGGINIPLP